MLMVPTCANCLREMVPVELGSGRVWRCPVCGLVRVLPPAVEERCAAARECQVAEAIHSGEMEGLHVSAAGRADAGEYVAGRIDSDELVARARARYGLG